MVHVTNDMVAQPRPSRIVNIVLIAEAACGVSIRIARMGAHGDGFMIMRFASVMWRPSCSGVPSSHVPCWHCLLIKLRTFSCAPHVSTHDLELKLRNHCMVHHERR